MNESPMEAIININGERVDKDSILVEDLPSQMKVESSDPCVSDVDLKKEPKIGPQLDFFSCSSSTSTFSERDTRRALREEIKMDRLDQKLAIILKKRGISKDVFDMRSLNESLPSGASEKKLGFRRNRLQNSEAYPCWMRQNIGRFGGIRYSMSSYNSQSGKLSDATPSPNAEMSPSAYGLVRGHVNSCFLQSLRKTRKLARKERKETPASAEQGGGSEDKHNSLVEKFLGVWEDQDAPSSVNGPKTSTISDEPDDNESIEKTPDVENCLQFPPLLIPRWDSEKSWNTDLESPGMSVPLNSPTKGKADADRSGSMTKCLLQLQRSRFEMHREWMRFRLLNSHRGVISEDGSECEGPSSKQTSRNSRDVLTNLRKSVREARVSLNSAEDQIGFMGYDMHRMRQLMRIQTKLSCENKRSIESSLSSGNVNSDKVLPD